MGSEKLFNNAAKFVKALLDRQLPQNMHFHNLQHTQYVVNAATQIGLQSKISKEEMTIIKIAAWFHDTGYCYAYTGHEDNSIAIAATFLKQENCDENFINKVVACINSTKIPQNPQSLLQEIMCDADMFHLADDAYLDFALRLKMEWEVKLDKKYSDGEWKELNLNLLIKHKYFTQYGKSVLQNHKLSNIDKLLKL
jgi:uncharacterized protein